MRFLSFSDFWYAFHHSGFRFLRTVFYFHRKRYETPQNQLFSNINEFKGVKALRKTKKNAFHTLTLLTECHYVFGKNTFCHQVLLQLTCSYIQSVGHDSLHYYSTSIRRPSKKGLLVTLRHFINYDRCVIN